MAAPSHFKMFLQNMVPSVPLSNTTEADHVIRRSMAILRLCYQDVPAGFDLLDQRLQQNVDNHWMQNYEEPSADQFVSLEATLCPPTRISIYKFLSSDIAFEKGSPPAKVVWSILETLHVPYEKKCVDLLEKREQKMPDYLAINPGGKVPFIQDEDFSIGESRAIICYLCSKFEDKNKETKLYPTDLRSKAKVDQAMYQDFQYFTNIVEYLNVAGVFFREPREVGPIVNRWHGVQEMLNGFERRLHTSKYMALNEMTVADFSALACVAGIDILLPTVKQESYPRLFEWKKEMESLPMYNICYGDSVAKFKSIYDSVVQKNTKSAGQR